MSLLSCLHALAVREIGEESAELVLRSLRGLRTYKSEIEKSKLGNVLRVSLNLVLLSGGKS